MVGKRKRVDATDVAQSMQSGAKWQLRPLNKALPISPILLTILFHFLSFSFSHQKPKRQIFFFFFCFCFWPHSLSFSRQKTSTKANRGQYFSLYFVISLLILCEKSGVCVFFLFERGVVVEFSLRNLIITNFPNHGPRRNFVGWVEGKKNNNKKKKKKKGNQIELDFIMVESSGEKGKNEGAGAVDGGGRALKKGPWTAAEDGILIEYVKKHGEGNWNAVQKHTGLARCGKSCRLRWANHLRPNLKKGSFSQEEERVIIELHAKLGNKWARMAAQVSSSSSSLFLFKKLD